MTMCPRVEGNLFTVSAHCLCHVLQKGSGYVRFDCWVTIETVGFSCRGCPRWEHSSSGPAIINPSDMRVSTTLGFDQFQHRRSAGDRVCFTRQGHEGDSLAIFLVQAELSLKGDTSLLAICLPGCLLISH